MPVRMAGVVFVLSCPCLSTLVFGLLCCPCLFLSTVLHGSAYRTHRLLFHNMYVQNNNLYVLSALPWITVNVPTSYSPLAIIF